MLRTTPTRIELKQDDVREYEEMKEEWRKEFSSSKPQHDGTQAGNVSQQNMVKDTHKDERHSRMGYKA
jgi:hypothetical protein